MKITTLCINMASSSKSVCKVSFKNIFTNLYRM
nr:MAG TPA: hypothetical protein [Caudoviricetes sp.]